MVLQVAVTVVEVLAPISQTNISFVGHFHASLVPPGAKANRSGWQVVVITLTMEGFVKSSTTTVGGSVTTLRVPVKAKRLQSGQVEMRVMAEKRSLLSAIQFWVLALKQMFKCWVSSSSLLLEQREATRPLTISTDFRELPLRELCYSLAKMMVERRLRFLTSSLQLKLIGFIPEMMTSLALEERVRLAWLKLYWERGYDSVLVSLFVMAYFSRMGQSLPFLLRTINSLAVEVILNMASSYCEQSLSVSSKKQPQEMRGGLARSKQVDHSVLPSSYSM